MKNIQIVDLGRDYLKDSAEVIERKGLGHPDTLSDALAETLSVMYSNYTLNRFGVVLHHNFDKLGILGGKTDVTYGYGELTNPVRVMLNGRASTKFGDSEIPIRELLEKTTSSFFDERFGALIDADSDIEIHYNVVGRSSPGRMRETTGSRAYTFEPRTVNDVKGYDNLVSNDTSVGCSYAPLSEFEKSILEIEKNLLDRKLPWLGSDIKILGVKEGKKNSVTVCVPQIANYVDSEKSYLENKETAKNIVGEAFGESDIEVSVNTRDDLKKHDLYLTAIGSSIESGDEGLVGRGNRTNGLITPFRPMSIEGACGKNPVYYVGKVYNILSRQIANAVYNATGKFTETLIVSQNGRQLLDPWKSIVRIDNPQKSDEEAINHVFEEKLAKVPEITKGLLEKKFQLY